MPGTQTVTKVYILSNLALFAQGIRSLLRGQRVVRIVGMGKDVAKCLETMESLHPEVVIVEQSNGAIEPSTLGTILQQCAVRRVVALNIDQSYATVYDRRSFAITNSEDLVNAIQTGRGSGGLTSPVRSGLPKRPCTGAVRAKSPPRPRAPQRARP